MYGFRPYASQPYGVALPIGTAGTGGNLLVDNGVSATHASTLVLTQLHVLTVSGGVSATNGSAFAITQTHVLVVDASVSATNAQTVAITQVLTLPAEAGVSATNGSTPAITQVHALAVDAAISATNGSEPAITQVHALSVDNGVSATNGSNVTIPPAGTIDLTVPGGVSATVGGDVSITVISDDVVSLGGGKKLKLKDWYYDDLDTRVIDLSIDASVSRTQASEVAISVGYSLAVEQSTSATHDSSVRLEQMNKRAGLWRTVETRRSLTRSRSAV